MAISPTIEAITNATDTGRRLVWRTKRVMGRAMATRKANRPIALITERNITHRAITSRGDVAEPAMLGTGNFGAGPGLGPAANVNAP